MINLLMPDTVLLGDSDEGGWAEGYCPVPGDLLREWIADAIDEQGASDLRVEIRRLYQRPDTGALVAMDSVARRFTGRLADYLRLRDRACRTPWCDAPVRHLDHAEDHATGGATTAANAQGLCEACNYAKQLKGWIARAGNAPPDELHTITTTTPTGHTYTSTAEPIGRRRRPRLDFYPVVLAVA